MVNFYPRLIKFLTIALIIAFGVRAFLVFSSVEAETMAVPATSVPDPALAALKVPEKIIANKKITLEEQLADEFSTD